jgi:hypothetical protein
VLPRRDHIFDEVFTAWLRVGTDGKRIRRAWQQDSAIGTLRAQASGIVAGGVVAANGIAKGVKWAPSQPAESLHSNVIICQPKKGSTLFQAANLPLTFWRVVLKCSRDQKTPRH